MDPIKINTFDLAKEYVTLLEENKQLQEEIAFLKEQKLENEETVYQRGYVDAVNFYVTNPILNMRPQDNVRNGCLVCGKSGVSHQVCYNSRCPTRATFTTTETTGAIGAAYLNMTPPGTNGPTGGDTK